MRFSGLPDDLNQNGIEFLKTDLDISLTFASIALDAKDDIAKKERNRANARKAYDAVAAWRGRFALTEVEARQIEEKLGKLKDSLRRLGEEFRDATPPAK